MVRVLYFVTFYLVYVSGVDYSRSDVGYAMGFTYECHRHFESPSVRVLSTHKLSRLFLSVVGPEKKLTAFNYYQAKEIANHMDFNNRTVIYVKGYWELFFQPVTRTICQQYRKMGYNVLVLDTAFMRTVRTYPRAASYVRPIGLHVAEMLAKLSKLGLDPKKLDIVGVSMGAHTAGFIAKNYRQTTGVNISSITALDPAGPCFRHLGPEERLDPSDADFVMDMAVNIDGYGMATPLGHVTFYVNGGEFQPADIWYIPCDVECSHSKTYAFWVSALLNPHTFLGIKCDTIQQARDLDCYDVKPLVYNSMDLFVDRSKPGIYFVPTFSRYPYSLGKAGLKKQNEPVMKHLETLNEAPVMKWSYCQSFYTCSLWIKYTKKAYSALRVQFNNGYRMLLGLPRACSASGMFAAARLDDFYAIMRKRAAFMMRRVRGSHNTSF